ncbi:MAG: MarR family winged helix-turn-helix transcriptional regulator [Bacteroidales bacterium]|nr:MarR family winged helix-turn-helix transcriptional regulator [Bacteroidales bacterium]
MNLKDTIDFHIKGTWHSLTKMYNRIASQHDTSQTVAYILVNIDREGTPATQIAARLGMEPTSLSRVLKKMEDQDFIRKEVDLHDKRIMKIFLTNCGIEKRKFVKKILIDFNKKVFENVSKNDLKIFYKVIDTINNIAYQENPANIKQNKSNI